MGHALSLPGPIDKNIADSIIRYTMIHPEGLNGASRAYFALFFLH